MYSTIKKRLKKILPSAQIIRAPDTKLISIRWVRYGFDYVSSSGMRFAQYQIEKKKIRWVMLKPSGAKDPMFIRSNGWKINTSLKTLKTGCTTKPLDLRKYWRTNENRKGEGLSRQGNAAIKLVR